MSDNNTCTTSSVIPSQVSIAFGCIYGVILIGVMVYSFLKLMQQNEKFKNSKMIKKVKMWAIDTWRRKSCFLPVFTHLADQISDIAVAIEFGLLASTTTKEDCNGLRMVYLFILTILSMVVYRTVSAYFIYRNTKSFLRIISQLLDLELFRALSVNFKLNKDRPCDPQRWITGMEATFESAPQALVQMIYLSKTNSWSESPIVVFSFIWSVFSIISKQVSNDKRIALKGAKFTKEPLWYALRSVWRFCDVSARIFILGLIWLTVGGTPLAIIVGLECLMLLVVCYRTKHWSFMFAVVSIPNNDRLFLYRLVSNFVILILITCFITLSFECWRCQTVDQRREVTEGKIPLTMLVFSWFASLFIILKFKLPFKTEGTASRNLAEMAKTKDWDGIREMHLYSSVKGSWAEHVIGVLPELYPTPNGFKVAKATITIIPSQYSSRAQNEQLRQHLRDRIDALETSVLTEKIAKSLGIDMSALGLVIIPWPSDEGNIFTAISLISSFSEDYRLDEWCELHKSQLRMDIKSYFRIGEGFAFDISRLSHAEFIKNDPMPPLQQMGQTYFDKTKFRNDIINTGTTETKHEIGIENCENIHDFFDINRQELARGSSCRVFKAIDKTESADLYAIKQMKRETKWNPRLFEEEVRILRKLDHPNIVQYKRALMDEENFYLLTSLCTGQELFEKAAELGHFSERYAAKVIRAILDAMSYCHAQNVVHRDLKLENIVISENDKVTIIDWGDAKEVTEDSIYDDFAGTSFYLPPEFRKKRKGSELKKGDLWSIGVMTYVLLTGTPLLWAKSDEAILKKVEEQKTVDFTDMNNVSAQGKDFMSSLLQINPEQRFSAADARKHPWISGDDADTYTMLQLSTMNSATKLKKLVVFLAENKLEKALREEYEKQFNVFAQGDGWNDKLERGRVTELFVKCNLEQKEAEQKAQMFIQHLSPKNEKTPHRQNWILSNVATMLSSEHCIEREYEKLDMDKDGIISANDLRHIYRDGINPLQNGDDVEIINNPINYYFKWDPETKEYCIWTDRNVPETRTDKECCVWSDKQATIIQIPSMNNDERYVWMFYSEIPKKVRKKFRSYQSNPQVNGYWEQVTEDGGISPDHLDKIFAVLQYYYVALIEEKAELHELESPLALNTNRVFNTVMDFRIIDAETKEDDSEYQYHLTWWNLNGRHETNAIMFENKDTQQMCYLRINTASEVEWKWWDNDTSSGKPMGVYHDQSEDEYKIYQPLWQQLEASFLGNVQDNFDHKLLSVDLNSCWLPELSKFLDKNQSHGHNERQYVFEVDFSDETRTKMVGLEQISYGHNTVAFARSIKRFMNGSYLLFDLLYSESASSFIQALIAEVDENNDGTITFEEFTKAMKCKPAFTSEEITYIQQKIQLNEPKEVKEDDKKQTEMDYFGQTAAILDSKIIIDGDNFETSFDDNFIQILQIAASQMIPTIDCDKIGEIAKENNLSGNVFIKGREGFKNSVQFAKIFKTVESWERKKFIKIYLAIKRWKSSKSI